MPLFLDARTCRPQEVLILKRILTFPGLSTVVVLEWLGITTRQVSD